MSEAVHATTVALWRDGGWRAVLLRGASGAGKSTLALRAMTAGWRLVADDRTVVWASGGRLYGRAPVTIEGLVEARGVGVVSARTLAWAPLTLAVDLVTAATVERMPEPRSLVLHGIAAPLIALCAEDAAAVAKLALALDAALASSATSLGVVRGEAYQARRAVEFERTTADGGLI